MFLAMPKRIASGCRLVKLCKTLKLPHLLICEGPKSLKNVDGGKAPKSAKKRQKLNKSTKKILNFFVLYHIHQLI